MANSLSGESVTARLARIVLAFDADRPSLTLTALARRAGLPLSTAQRLVADMLVHGFLARDADGCLIIGTLIRGAGSPVPARAFLGLRNTAVPLMESVYAVLQQQITLAVFSNGEALYLERVSPDSTATNITQKMARLPLLSTPSGLVLLAHQPADYREQVVAGSDWGEDLRTVLAQARTEGYVTRPGIITKGTVAVAVPVLGDIEGLPAALTAVVPATEAQIPLTVAVLRAASFAIAAAAAASDRPDPLTSRRL